MATRTTMTAGEVAFVQAQRVARLATADVEGRPHVVPVCYAYDGSRFYTPLDEKPKRVSDRGLRRVRNIEARGDVALLVDHYDDDWSQLGYVLIEGRAILIGPDDPGHPHALTLLRQRYHQYRAMALETRPVIAITPQRITSWGPTLRPIGMDADLM
jgi:PPOX class probable F420-dependent enzyme